MKNRCMVHALSVLLFAGSTTMARAQDAPSAQASRWAAVLEHGLRPSIAKPGEAVPRWTMRERMTHYKVPGVAVAVLEDGKVVYAAGFGVREAGTDDAVDADTMFSVGSVSKMAAAATSLRLVAQGRIALDRDVGTYLKSWQIPAAPGIRDPKVTLRMLLSHTSGLGVHGFEDYLPGEKLPTILETLDGKPPAKNDPVRLQHEPGAQSDYSGGGITVEQLLIEDVSGKSLVEVAREQVFEPLDMRRSTFESPLPARYGNIAKAHDREGKPTALPRGWQSFPEQAASGLWISARDLGTFVAALIESYRGDGGLLPRAIATQMMTEVSPGARGLGPELSGSGATRRFLHDGSNDSYHAAIEGYLDSGDGLVILTNGKNSKGLRGEIRNAISDALGHGMKPLIRTIALDMAAPTVADLAGTYRLDPAVPMDLRGELADEFDVDTLEVKLAEGALAVTAVGEDDTSPLLPLTPARFLASQFGAELQFHRDAHGRVRALSVETGTARAYYRRAPAVPK